MRDCQSSADPATGLDLLNRVWRRILEGDGPYEALETVSQLKLELIIDQVRLGSRARVRRKPLFRSLLERLAGAR